MKKSKETKSTQNDFAITVHIFTHLCQPLVLQSTEGKQKHLNSRVHKIKQTILNEYTVNVMFVPNRHPALCAQACLWYTRVLLTYGPLISQSVHLRFFRHTEPRKTLVNNNAPSSTIKFTSKSYRQRHDAAFTHFFPHYILGLRQIILDNNRVQKDGKCSIIQNNMRKV